MTDLAKQREFMSDKDIQRTYIAKLKQGESVIGNDEIPKYWYKD